ncbi:MAG: hypothetical protein DRN29_01445 [Thermoplasmata archaeon]|nr:MAG: hypothetical protein DRN29_01445 [Thermoplasmata archaeon]
MLSYLGDNILEILDKIIPYISGIWTLPWIVVGFFITIFLTRFFGEEKIDAIMKKVGLVLLFVFIPILLFRLFLDVNFTEEEIDFVVVSCVVMAFLYIIAYLFAMKKVRRVCDKKEKRIEFIKTVIVNQGRSAAFVGGAMLAIERLAVYAAIYISLLGIFLFAIIPYILAVLHKKEIEGGEEKNPLPLFLRIYPWYLLIFPISAAIIHAHTGLTTSTYEWGKILRFLGAITIPAALYYVGAGIKVKDLSKKELQNLFFSKKGELAWVKEIIFLTVILTPIIIAAIFGTLMLLHLIPSEWFVVLLLNSILPITSTNMFLIPYGINGRVTALAVTWTTVISVPLFVVLLNIFSFFLL